MNNHGTPFMLEEKAFKALEGQVFEGEEKSYYLTQYTEKTVVLGIRGPLIKKGSFWDMFWGVSAYDSINKELKALLKNDRVENIILDIDSPGGMVNGCGELAETIYRARNKKNIISYVTGQSCSAAYYLASAASKVMAHKSATVGSIGVIASFVTNKGDNTKITNIVSSKSKDKLLDIETEEGKAKIQSYVDKLANLFMQDVARYRNLDIKDIEQTNGGTFLGQDALDVKLIDGISDLETIIEEFEMENQEQIHAAQTQATAESEIEVDVQAIAQRTADITAKAYELNLQGLGQNLVNSSMSAEDALAALEAAATDVEVKAEEDRSSLMPTDFNKTMESIKNPEVGAKVDKAENDFNAEVDSYFKA